MNAEKNAEQLREQLGVEKLVQRAAQDAEGVVVKACFRVRDKTGQKEPCVCRVCRS